ncbi:MAG: hypothetical protein HONBIEJF_01183 [Fimbriimonadaceae bacterium]|nr:hypothetical protein [Fimbriimonadaceae bacterium]
MLQHVLEAVPTDNPPIIVGGKPGLSPRQVESGENFIDSLGKGLAAVETDRFLLATADLPFLTRESVDDFIDRCDSSALLNYPIVPESVVKARFPEMARTTLKLREGRFTGGNIAVIRTDLMRGSLPILEKAYRLRKQPLRLAAIVGLKTLIRVVAGQALPSLLPIAALERSVGKLMGGPVRAIITAYAEIGADIDNADQYREMLKIEPVSA